MASAPVGVLTRASPTVSAVTASAGTAGSASSAPWSFHAVVPDAVADGSGLSDSTPSRRPSRRGPPLRVHGDPLPVNVVFPDGTLSGVIADFDDMSAGDPVCGLAAAWLVLLAGAASRFFDVHARADAATIRRARGPAVLESLILVPQPHVGAARRVRRRLNRVAAPASSSPVGPAPQRRAVHPVSRATSARRTPPPCPRTAATPVRAARRGGR
ncbi:phosphotransferase [Streptomyces sp. WAC00469]|uniref:phosphotransferase n=1 Tax=Streptomyces sp. WAC00469 TaxID=2487415 RepID=UPI0037DDCCB1